MTKLQPTIFLLLLSFAFVFTSCSDDDDNTPQADNEEELITTVQVIIDGSQTFEYNFIDNVASADDITLSPNTSYNVELKFLNKEENPVEDITSEIQEEGDEHLICFDANSIAVSYTDADVNDLEVGLMTTWQTGNAATEQMIITLKHQPDVKETLSAIDCSVGSTDVEAIFDVIVQ